MEMNTFRRCRVRTKGAGAGLAVLALACATPTDGARAGAVVQFGDNQSLSIGLGMRDSYTSTEKGAPNGTANSSDFSLESVRLYIDGSLSKYIKATFNTERNSSGNINVLDGIARFEFDDAFNIWAGRMLPPSDRANLDGPYYLNTWSYPGIVSMYPSKFDGRDDGATVWGKLIQKRLVYSFGSFSGHNRISGASNAGDNMLWAGRVAYNFLDPEPDPAYYTSSTYYGAADVLTLGVAGMYQKNGVGSAAAPGDYKSWNVDALYEKKFGDLGTGTLEGAFYHYDTSGATDVSTTFNSAGSTDNVGGLAAGPAYLLGAAYLIPAKVYWGQFQPVFRYQNFHNQQTNKVTDQYDMGLNYIISGHNARISADYSIKQVTGSSDTGAFILGVQLQF